jgi:hypothetical protein
MSVRILRRALFAAALAGLLTSGGQVRADGNAPVWRRDPKDPRWVQGEVTVDASPDAVFARVERVDAWPHFLTDVLRLRVLEHRPGASHWKIELETRTLGHGMLGYDVEVGPGRALKLYTNRLGVKAVAHTLVRPVGTSQANVVYSFFLELSGLPSLLISDKELRQKQEHMVAVTLADVARAFPPKPVAVAPPANPPAPPSAP